MTKGLKEHEEKKLAPLTRSSSEKIYKIGCFANRKDARRRHVGSFRAKSDEEAIRMFCEEVSRTGDSRYTYRLYSGDWKREIYQFY